MAFTTAQVAVAATAVRLVEGVTPGHRDVIIRSASATESLTIGPDSSVTTANGFTIPAGLDAALQQFTIGPGEEVWGISLIGGTTAHVLVCDVG